jgi:hypothetical protein
LAVFTPQVISTEIYFPNFMPGKYSTAHLGIGCF